MDIGAIKSRIAELEQRKAERNAMRGYRDVSYLDYITQGDRSGFDRIDAEEQAYRNMLKQQAQQERLLGLQQSNQERMLGLQQEQQDKMLAAQQEFTAKENALNREVTLAGIRANNDKQNKASTEALEKELNNLIVTKETLEAAGKDSRVVTARIEQIYKEHPEVKRPELGEYDPLNSFEYIRGQYGDYDSNNTLDELNLARKAYFNDDNTPKFKTPEFAKEIARLDKEIARRKKYDEQQAQILKDLKEYVKSGTVSQLLYDVGYSEGGPARGRYLQRNGRGKKSYRKYAGGSKGLPTPK